MIAGVRISHKEKMKGESGWGSCGCERGSWMGAAVMDELEDGGSTCGRPRRTARVVPLHQRNNTTMAARSFCSV